ncbi:MAG: electron transport complex subunit RsxC [Gammaproteobacteria bacterium]|nr:electron transport complex subunit RsxC [Gammaproteobacteria bacterium]
MIKQLFKFIGGVHIPQYKDISCNTTIQQAPIASQLVLPLSQHIGSPSVPIVHIGDHVLKGQTIAIAEDYVSVNLHAPTSGQIIAIEPRAIPHPSGLPAQCIVLQSDGKDQWRERKPIAEDYRQLDPSKVRNLIREAGIVGLGGAGFPSFIKMNPGPSGHIDTLILNAAECEPFITCDDRLLQERADEVIQGLFILRYALQAKHCVIAVEDNKAKAITALNKALETVDQSCIQVTAIPTIYPAGGEKQLIHTITGRQVPSHGLPIHIGVVVQNVATAAAIYAAIFRDEPLISRIVTLTGDVSRPTNYEVLLGTSMQSLIEQSDDSPQNKIKRIIMGGPMMGFAMHSSDIPIIKTCNCVIVDKGLTAELKQHGYTMPCIRCGQCADVCPAELLPQQLYWYTKSAQWQLSQDYQLFDCIECGCCDYVCPSYIPLVQYYRYAKAQIWEQERETEKSDHARERHEFRLERIEREKKEREERHRQKKAALGKKDTDPKGEKTKPDPKKAAIIAAMERVKQKKAQQNIQAKNTDNLTVAQKKQIEEADARRKKVNDEDSSS